jgi:hypothetical protein
MAMTESLYYYLIDWTKTNLRFGDTFYRQIDNMKPFNLVQYISNGILAAVLLSSCTFSFSTTLFFDTVYTHTLYNILQTVC